MHHRRKGRVHEPWRLSERQSCPVPHQRCIGKGLVSLFLMRRLWESQFTRVMRYHVSLTNVPYSGQFSLCKFSYEIPIRIFNIRTAQHGDVEPIVQGNFSYDALQYEIYKNYPLYGIITINVY